MFTPFPGMDPFIEGFSFHDFHHSIIHEIKRLIFPQLSDAYALKTEGYIYTYEKKDSEGKAYYPDLGLFESGGDVFEEPESAYATKPIFTPPTTKISSLSTVDIRLPRLEIIGRGDSKLITVIEVLSPINKRQPARDAYLEKFKKLQGNNVHVLEIDLLRRGKRAFDHPIGETADYFVRLARADEREMSIWAMTIRDGLPVVPVPLLPSDNDLVLDLGAAMSSTFEVCRFQYDLKYKEDPPPPVFSEDDKKWIRKQVDVYIEKIKKVN